MNTIHSDTSCILLLCYCLNTRFIIPKQCILNLKENKAIMVLSIYIYIYLPVIGFSSS